MERSANKNLVVGILAHVDAGKTTLAEGILYTSGKIRNLGRVDHKDAFLDTFALEKERGITIFSKQAKVQLGEWDITLLDTPGHVDFSAEMERTLQVLDYAILVISGADGVQGHVRTLWQLLKRYEVPVFLFVNKMDQEGTDRQKLLEELQKQLEERCVLFGAWDGHPNEMRQREEQLEELAMCDETLMEEYLERGELSQESIAEAIAERKVFPCYFGSALKLWGVEEFLLSLQSHLLQPEYPKEFGAKVFKIARDNTGNRLTYLKVTGGELKVKMPVTYAGSMESEKADQLRIYEGSSFTTADVVTAGGICAVTGLTRTYIGQGLGYERENEAPTLEPVLTYQLLLPEGEDPIKVLGQLRKLEEEEPLYHILWKEEVQEIHVQVMGEVQLEVLKRILADRFALEVSFGAGSIVYKETIAEPVVGIGHFEPLRHYAEVHLLLEPGEPGSGLQFASVCSEDILDKNWQRLIMTHLEEKSHVGVLTGSQITDMRIVLLAGRAHIKHTEGGDFRQATYRAVRHGLRRGKNVLLEPVFSFVLELPTELLGRAMSDVQRMHGSFETPETIGETSILKGKAPVATMRDYQREVNAYTRGRGRFSCTVTGYEPCHNAEEVLAQTGYDPDLDTQNPASSVFCAHGAGFIVDWDRVEEYAHVAVKGLKLPGEGRSDVREELQEAALRASGGVPQKQNVSDYITQEEIDEIFNRTYGQKNTERNRFRKYHCNRTEPGNSGYISNEKYHTSTKKEDYLLVDGYNIIFAWDELRELAAHNIDSARDKLIDIMSNYQGYLGSTLIIVFDAYKVKGNPGAVQRYHNIYVVYTKEAETADQYIEKTVHEIGKKYHVTVATSDALEQMIIWGDGAARMSARGLKEAVDAADFRLREQYLEKNVSVHYQPFAEDKV